MRPDQARPSYRRGGPRCDVGDSSEQGGRAFEAGGGGQDHAAAVRERGEMQTVATLLQCWYVSAGNNGIVAATGTTPNSTPTDFSRMFEVVKQILQLATGTPQPAL